VEKMKITLSSGNRKLAVTVEPNRSKSGAERPFILKCRDAEFVRNLVEVSGIPDAVEVGKRYAYTFLTGTQLSAAMSNMVPEELVPVSA